MVTSLAAKVRMGDTVTTAHQFYYDKLHIDLLSVTQYWDEQRKRYSSKSLEIGDQSQQNQHWEPQSQQTDSFVEKTEKTQNQPKNDDLPF